ncbi:MAG: hypothetical protein JXJ04_04750, partial [Spirochaetales bacterium]|nr:hypothetical protein [Spirochaetales bacterium]
MGIKAIQMRYRKKINLIFLFLVIISGCVNMDGPGFCQGVNITPGNFDAFEQKLWSFSDAWKETTATREKICLHGMWRFQPALNGGAAPPDSQSTYYSKVPGRWLSVMYYQTFNRVNDQLFPVASINQKELFSYFDGWYTRYLEIPPEIMNKTTLITIDYIGASSSKIFINDCLVKTTTLESDNSYGLLDRVTIDISAFSHLPSIKLDIFLHFDNYKTPTDIQGLSLDYMFLHSFDSPVAVKDSVIMTSVRNQKVRVDLDIYNLNKEKSEDFTLKAFIYDKDGDTLVKETNVYPFSLQGEEIENVVFEFPWNDAEYWDKENPHLYYMKIRLFNNNNLVDESYKEDFGFREFWENGGNFYLNGKKVHLFNFASAEEIFSRYQYLYCREEVIAETINSVKNVGFNCGLMNIAWQFRYGGDGSYQGSSSAYLKTVFNASDKSGFYWILSTPFLAGDMDTTVYKRDVRKHMRAWGNHPSIIMNSATFNTSGYPWAQHPDMVDDLEYEPQFAYTRRKTARLSEQIIKEVDPTREVYHNYSGNLNNIYTTMHYMSFGLPLQEREDWPSKWAETKKTAFFPSEFGLPLRGQFLDFNGPQDWWSGKSLILEHGARYFGDQIYNDALKPVVYTNPRYTTRKDFDEQPGEILNPAYAKIKNLFMTSQLRAWRGYDVSGLGIFGEANEIFDRTFDQYQIKDMTYSTIKAPGLKPDIITVPNRVSHIDKPNELAFTLKKALSLLDIWIAGERDRFTHKDHGYFTGEKINKQAMIVNDTMENFSFQYTIQLIKNTTIVDSLTGESNVDPGEQKRIPFSFSAPDSGKREDYTLLLKVSGNSREWEDRFQLQVFPKVTFVPEAIDMGLFDTVNKTKAVLEMMGITFTDITSTRQLKGLSLLIIGKESMEDFKRDFLPYIEDNALFDRGLNLLVFEQSGTPLPGVKFEETSQRYVFIQDRDHPVFRGLRDVDFINWRGSSDLILPYSPVDPNTAYSPHYPHFKWKWGNTGIVATNVAKKPTFGNVHSLAGCGFDLSNTPLFEVDLNHSRLIFCQVDVTNRYGIDPAATLLVHNLMTYFYSLHGTVNLPAKSLVLTDNVDEDTFITQCNIDADIIHTIDSNIDGYDVLIIAGK